MPPLPPPAHPPDSALPLPLPEALERAFFAYQRGEWAEAARLCRAILDAKANHFDALHLAGVIALKTTRFLEATELLSEAVSVCPDNADAHYNRGNALGELNRHAAALECYERTLALKPDYVEAHINRGIALSKLGRNVEALETYDRALALAPDHPYAHGNRGNVLRDLNRVPEALESYERALQLKRGNDFLYGDWLRLKMQTCDWTDLARHFAALDEGIERFERISAPFPILATPSPRAIQRRAAEIWVLNKYPASRALPAISKRPKHDRIRIGYFSADFHDHATSRLMAELFERHDKSKFQLTAFSFGPVTNDAMRRRVSDAFDDFIDIRAQSDIAVAMLARTREIDIAVDLKGFTQDCRTGIFALRAAPIQVSYLGYPGTMGAQYIDYLIADATLIPEMHREHYAERIVYLPDSYQVNDTKRRIADNVFSRAALGLPDEGFVFCCFNNNYKITPGTFERWMRILKRVEGSVLWLLEDNHWARMNLWKEAALRGVGADRLIFAKRMSLPEHLARHRSADLFLDTLPYCAHTTASDALWAGLPLLTCVGETFAGRVGASLLHAIRSPELIATTPDEYERLAVDLAFNPDKLEQIRRKLAHNRLVTPLFDTQRFVRNIEAAYAEMYERHLTDWPPADIHVQA